MESNSWYIAPWDLVRSSARTWRGQIQGYIWYLTVVYNFILFACRQTWTRLTDQWNNNHFISTNGTPHICKHLKSGKIYAFELKDNVPGSGRCINYSHRFMCYVCKLSIIMSKKLQPLWYRIIHSQDWSHPHEGTFAGLTATFSYTKLCWASISTYILFTPFKKSLITNMSKRTGSDAHNQNNFTIQLQMLPV